MRIAIVVNSFPKVSETFIFNKVIHLIKAGWDVTVVVHHKSNDTVFFQDQMMNAKVKLSRANWSSGEIKSFLRLGWYVLANIPMAMRAFFRVLKREGRFGPGSIKRTLKLIPFEGKNFDIIHFEYSGLAIQYLDELDYLDSKKVISCRGTAELVKPLVDKSRTAQLEKLMTRIDLAHCVSQNMRSVMANFGIPPEKSFVNYPSIDIGFFTRTTAYGNVTNAEFTVVSTGRLTWVKGYTYALLGVKRTVDQGYNVRYEIIGEGESSDELTFLVEKLGVSGRVAFRGNLTRAEVKRALERADVFLLPSLSEGISNAALEAMAMEIPVVSTKVGGMGEVIADGENGMLINEMEPGEIADRLIDLIKNREVAKRLGKQAREVVVNGFSLKKQTEIFQEQYKKLYNEHQAKN